jgi:hypothetical protein
MVMFVVNLLYQRFGAILMSRHRFMKLFYLKNQAFSTVMLVGKLSNESNPQNQNEIWVIIKNINIKIDKFLKSSLKHKDSSFGQLRSRGLSL